VNPALEGYAAAVLETGTVGEAEQRAAELGAVDRLFAENSTLRAALTDTAVPPPARRSVVNDLLESRVSTEVRRAAAYAAASVSAPDVPVAITWLAHRARRVAAAVAGVGSGAGPAGPAGTGTWTGGVGTEDAEAAEAAEPVILGHIAARHRVGGFARALFEDMTTDQISEMEDELFRFGRTVETTPALRSTMTDRDLPVHVRRGVVDDLLQGKVDAHTLRLIDYVVLAGRARDFLGTLFWLVDRAAEARGWRVALVASAREVDDRDREKLSGSLSRLAGVPVELQVVVDPELLAGVRVRIGDLQVDATARSRIEQLREHMVPGGWAGRGFAEIEREALGEHRHEEREQGDG
jgi:F0F1-type ATP synthase delta subunit